MKATGIVRRIDDLGRVVIPKEIRRTLRIKEGTPLEIFTIRSLRQQAREAENMWENLSVRRLRKRFLREVPCLPMEMTEAGFR